MKIEDIINVMDDVSEILDLEGVHQTAAELYEAMKALEQHHKDLTGLVERWRTYAGTNWSKTHTEEVANDSLLNCADQLESLINPKD